MQVKYCQSPFELSQWDMQDAANNLKIKTEPNTGSQNRSFIKFIIDFMNEVI